MPCALLRCLLIGRQAANRVLPFLHQGHDDGCDRDPTATAASGAHTCQRPHCNPRMRAVRGMRLSRVPPPTGGPGNDRNRYALHSLARLQASSTTVFSAATQSTRIAFFAPSRPMTTASKYSCSGRNSFRRSRSYASVCARLSSTAAVPRVPCAAPAADRGRWPPEAWRCQPMPAAPASPPQPPPRRAPPRASPINDTVSATARRAPASLNSGRQMTSFAVCELDHRTRGGQRCSVASRAR